jgi:hypothetical protein
LYWFTTVTQKEKYQHQNRMMDNGQSNVYEVGDFLVIISFWYQNSTFQEIGFVH